MHLDIYTVILTITSKNMTKCRRTQLIHELTRYKWIQTICKYDAICRFANQTMF